MEEDNVTYINNSVDENVIDMQEVVETSTNNKIMSYLNYLFDNLATKGYLQITFNRTTPTTIDCEVKNVDTNKIYIPKDLSNKAPSINEENKNCIVCLSETSRYALNPCGHLCLCEKCVNNDKLDLDICPVCRVAIISILRIYT